MSEPVIRVLTAEDLDGALRLSTIVGWNQRVDDWRVLLRLAPAGAFAALVDGRIVGTSIGIDYGGFAWIAMMLVDPSSRGRGLGSRLLQVAMDAVPPTLPIRLDATPIGRPLYQRYGFRDETTLCRHVSGADGGAPPASGSFDNSFDVRPMTASDLGTVMDQDHAAFGGTRDAILEWALQSAPHAAHIVRTSDGLIHYCFGRPGRVFDQIGPVVAGGEEIAQALVSAALAATGHRPVVIDSFDVRTGFAAWLSSRGFSGQRPLFRMCRPATSPTGIGSSRVVEFAIFGPEFG